MRADLTVIHGRPLPIDSADAEPLRFPIHEARGIEGFDVTVTDVTENASRSIWGPSARSTEGRGGPDGLAPKNFPFAAIKPVRIAARTA